MLTQFTLFAQFLIILLGAGVFPAVLDTSPAAALLLLLLGAAALAPLVPVLLSALLRVLSHSPRVPPAGISQPAVLGHALPTAPGTPGSAEPRAPADPACAIA